MKKIMFNDKYSLTQAVLDGRKIMTRRIIPQDVVDYYENEAEDPTLIDAAKYWRGEVVAVAQSYQDAGFHPSEVDGAGWRNKMFVKADLMPHRIRITNVKVERLQDISDEDVYKEGFSQEFVNNGWGNSAYHEGTILVYYDHLGLTKEIRGRQPKEAFADLIDKVCGIGTWERNPWVFAYTFELLKGGRQ